MTDWEKLAKDLMEENDKLRGLLAKGDKDCAYCGLPAADIAKCVSGFPGCARMDDIVNAPVSEAEALLDHIRFLLLKRKETPMT